MPALARKIRVLHVLPWVASGGVERRRLSLAKFLPRDDFDQSVFCLNARGPLGDEIRACDVPVHSMGGMSIRDPRAHIGLARLIHQVKPDIIHGAVFEGVRMAVSVGRLMRVPHVIAEETSHATNRSTAGHAFFGLCVAASDACVAISPAVADYLHEHSRVPRHKIRTIPNGVPIPDVVSVERATQVRDELGLPPGSVLCTTVGRLYDDTHKRVSDIIRAMALVAREHDGIHLAVVGDGPVRAELAELADQLDVADRVHFMGYRHDVDAIYAASDVFVLASGREGFGLVVAEAMMHGLPTLTTLAGGIANIVKPGETGLTFAIADVDSLASHLTSLAQSSSMRNSLGLAGKARAEAEFSSKRYAADVERLYREIM